MTMLQPSHITLTEERTFIPLVNVGTADSTRVTVDGSGRPIPRNVAARARVSSGLLDVRSLRSISDGYCGEDDEIEFLGRTHIL